METKRNLSHVGGGLRMMSVKRPSALIPFKGNLPVLKESEIKEYYELAQNNMYLEDLTDEQQAKFVKGFDMYCMENGFMDYLSNKSITTKEYTAMPDTDKNTILTQWLDASCIDEVRLTIR